MQNTQRTPKPTVLPPLTGLDINARYHSIRTGGDFFDAILVGPHLVFLLTDIAGELREIQSIAAEVQDVLRTRAIVPVDGKDLSRTAQRHR